MTRWPGHLLTRKETKALENDEEGNRYIERYFELLEEKIMIKNLVKNLLKEVKAGRVKSGECK